MKNKVYKTLNEHYNAINPLLEKKTLEEKKLKAQDYKYWASRVGSSGHGRRSDKVPVVVENTGFVGGLLRCNHSKSVTNSVTLNGELCA